MKLWLKFGVGVVILLVVLLLALVLFAGHIVKTAVNTAGPKALGVPITLKNVRVNILNGRFGLDELVIGNPEGFKTPEAIRVHEVSVDVKMASLFSRVLVVDRIYVGGPEITYEIGLKGSNIGAIQDKTATATPAAKQPEPADQPATPSKGQPQPEDKSAKKVRIDDFLIENGKINVSAIGMAGHDVTVPLPAIHLTDIGKESEGATFPEVLAKVFGALGGAVSGAASSIVGGVGTIGKGAVDLGVDSGKAALDTGKAVGAGAVDAGKAVGAGAVDAGKAVGKGASKAVESVGGLFK